MDWWLVYTAIGFGISVWLDSTGTLSLKSRVVVRLLLIVLWPLTAPVLIWHGITMHQSKRVASEGVGGTGGRGAVFGSPSQDERLQKRRAALRARRPPPIGSDAHRDRPRADRYATSESEDAASEDDRAITRAWAWAALDLGIEVRLWPTLIIAGATVHPLVLVTEFGFRSGMLVFGHDSIKDTPLPLDELIDAGFGFSVFSYVDYDRDGFIEILTDWQWNQAKRRPPDWYSSEHDSA